MFNYKFINIDGLKIKLEIYGTTREIYLFYNDTNEYKFLGCLDLKLKNDKNIYNEIMNLKNKENVIKYFEKINWM